MALRMAMRIMRRNVVQFITTSTQPTTNTVRQFITTSTQPTTTNTVRQFITTATPGNTVFGRDANNFHKPPPPLFVPSCSFSILFKSSRKVIVLFNHEQVKLTEGSINKTVEKVVSGLEANQMQTPKVEFVMYASEGEMVRKVLEEERNNNEFAEGVVVQIVERRTKGGNDLVNKMKAKMTKLKDGTSLEGSDKPTKNFVVVCIAKDEECGLKGPMRNLHCKVDVVAMLVGDISK